VEFALVGTPVLIAAGGEVAYHLPAVVVQVVNDVFVVIE